MIKRLTGMKMEQVTVHGSKNHAKNQVKAGSLELDLKGMHFFLGPFDWYITEFDGQDTMFGYVRIAAAPDSSEWGYISLSELKNITHNGFEVDRDLYWNLIPFKDIVFTPPNA